MGQYLERYLQGECESVWDELLALGEACSQEPLYTDAWAVAKTTMQRVRQHVAVLIPRLRTLGYTFGSWEENPLPHWKAETSSPENTETSPILEEWEEWEEGKLVPTVPYVPPPQEIQQYLDRLERVCGPLPLSVRAFFLEVGGVNLVGTHPLWDALLEPGLWQYYYLLESPLNPYPYGVSGLDGLYIDPLNSEMLEYYLEEYNEYTRSPTNRKDDPFQLHLSPDSYHKMDISGGAPYAIALPNRAIDGLLLHEWHQTTFVNYLRICFHYGGLPGLFFLQPPLLASHQEEIAEALVFLRQDLLPI